MSTALVPFQFEGDTLEVLTHQNQLWVSVRRICDALGIDNTTQQAKLKKKPWATVGIWPTVAQDGKLREVFCIHLDSLPMWLANVESSRVREDIRPKLETYQLKCAQVLRDAFLNSAASMAYPSTLISVDSHDPLELMIHQMQGLITVASELRHQAHRLATVEHTVSQLQEKQQVAEQALLTLERAPEKPAEKNTRARLNELVRAYCRATSLAHSVIWNRLYHELYYRCHFDAKSRAKHKSQSTLDVVEQEGRLEDLYQIASSVLIMPTSYGVVA